MTNINADSQSLPWTGERYLPEIGGNIELEHLHRYVFAKQFTSGKRVLDIASGEGYGSALLAKNAISVVGVDISPESVTHATTKYQADNLEFRLGSCAAIPLADQSVEIVVSFETIEHHDEHDAMMREIKRVLLPGGLLIISTPDKLEYSDKPGYDNPYHVRELYQEEFTLLLDAYFTNHRMAGQRVIYGSAIFDENSVSQVRSYDLSDKSLLATPGIRHAVYLVAVASDAGLPLLENCVLEASQTDVHQQLFSMGREHEKVVAWAKDLNQALIEKGREHDKVVTWAKDLNQALIEKGREHDKVVAWAKDLNQTMIEKGREHGKVVAWARDLNHAVNERGRQLSDLELSKTELDKQLISMGRERDKILALVEDLSQAVTERGRQIVNLRDELDSTVIAKDLEIGSLRNHLNEILRSRCWRVTAPLRKVVVAGRKVASQLRRGARTKIDAEVVAIRKSGLFDETLYRSTYPDLQSLPGDAIRHYCKHGWREGRNPSANFDTRHYLATYSDIRNADINPFWHYVVVGASEKRRGTGKREERVSSAQIDVEVDAIKKSGLFDESFYPSAYEDLQPQDSTQIDAEVEAIKQSGLFDESFYRSTYPDLQSLPGDAIRHYCEHGWREGRNPSANFDTRHYLATYSDIRDGDVNPFWHYVVAGASEKRHSAPERQERVSNEQIDVEVEAIKKSGLFDESFYRSMYPDLQPPPDDAVRHYCERGWREGRNPSDNFDTDSYLATYSDIRNADVNPFWHYVVAGASESRQGHPDAATRFESDIRFGFLETDIKLLALYTSPDWAELRGGRPVSKSQSQPLLPHAELGFYDLLDSLVLRRQAEMAKRHGLYGFCFQLGAGADGGAPSQPVELFLAHNDVDFRFCVQIEIRSEDIPESLVASLARAVSDQRFIHIQGRPVILVTVLSETQHAAPALCRLKNRLADRGVVRPFLIGRFASWEDCSDVSPADLCDAVLDLPIAPVPGETGDFVPLDKNGIDVAPYSVVASQGVARARTAQSSARPVFHCVTLGRDNTARKPKRPVVYTRFHIKEYRRWIDAAIAGARVSHPEDRRLVFVNAWNDWNEGLFLEPDRQGGFCRLNETTRSLLGMAPGATMPKVSVIVPNYNHELFLRHRLTSIYGQTYKNIEVILMDDSSSDRSRTLMDEYAASYPDITSTLYNNKNSGRPFRQWAKGIKAATGDLVWIAESDDYCDERFLEVLVRCFEDEAVLLAYANCCFVDKNENPMRDVFESYLSDLECSRKWNNSYVETAHNEVKTALGIKNTIPNASGVLFKRPIDLALLDDESWLSMFVAGDWVFYLHIIRGGKIAYSTGTTNFFRRYEGSTAEATYRKEVFYREVGMASRTVAALYDVPLAVLDRSRRTYQTFYEKIVGVSNEEFELWYDYSSVLHARETRLPNVMVSTMGFFPGGAEILPIRLANEYKRQGLSVLLLSAGLNAREDGVRRMLRNDVPVIETSDVDDVKAIIHDFGVEVLNTHQWHIQKYPLQVPDVFKELRAHIASLHGMIEHEEAFRASEEQLRSADQHVTTWVYTAEKNLVPFFNCGLYDKASSRFVKIPNGMTPPRIIPMPRTDMGIPENAFTLCCVSRAIPEKGWAETILVVQRARALSGQDIRLILVGNGPVYDEYCTAGVPDFVYLAGFSENSVGHYAAADMGIMLTKFKSESFPLTIVDCLFAGRPYIASDVGDIRNMLTTEGGLAGEVIELDNWEIPIERSAQVVAAFATDRQKYAKSLSLVQDLAKRYQIDVVVSQYVRLFQADMEKTAGREKELWCPIVQGPRDRGGCASERFDLVTSGGESQTDAAALFDDARGDLEQPESHCCELGPG